MHTKNAGSGDFSESVAVHNQDGSLRRKECLSDDGDTVKLSDARGREIASLYIAGDGE